MKIKIKPIIRTCIIGIITILIFAAAFSSTPETNSIDTPRKENNITVGLKVNAADLESDYEKIVNRADNAVNLGVNHSLEDFAGITRNEFVVDDKDITFSYEWHTDDTDLPFSIYKPSSAESAVLGIPLIVWLHGSGEVNVGEETLHYRGLHKVLDNWTLDGFHAYVVTPQLSGKASKGNWHNMTSVNQVQEIVDYMVENYSVDDSRVYLCGHSLGGMGTNYVASKLPDTFAAMATLSAYECGADIANINIPVRGYVGSRGLDGSSYHYMNNLFNNKYAFKQEELYVYAVDHGAVPHAAFNDDKDGNNKSDLIEWFLSH